MKNLFITATYREESHGDSPVMLLRRQLGRIFTLRRLCCVFGGVETERKYHWETVSNAIDAFEPSTAQKTATIQAEARKNDLQHDNARPHVTKPVKIYLETLKWEVLPHPPYSPDITPSDYYLLQLMAHGLAD